MLREDHEITVVFARWERLLSPTETDGLWEEWLESRQGQVWPGTFYDLVAGNFKPSLKARAMAVMLVPDFRLLPFASGRTTPFPCAPPVEGLPVEFLVFGAELIMASYSHLATDADRRSIYRRYALELLAAKRLPAEAEQLLLARIPWEDACRSDDEFAKFLAAPGIPESLKRQLDAISRCTFEPAHYAEVIGDELGGGYYQYFLGRDTGMALPSHPPPYSVELFALQLQCIIRFPFDEVGICAIPPKDQPRRIVVVLKILAGSEYTELRREFLRWFLKGRRTTLIRNTRELGYAEMLRAVYAADEEIAELLWRRIAVWHDRIQREHQAQAYKADEDRNVVRLLQRMQAD